MLIRTYKLRRENGKTSVYRCWYDSADQKQILHEIKNFYKKLFKAREVDQTHSIDSLINTNSITRLTNNQAAELEGKLTMEELSCALKSMKNNKSPGMDGFPAEFYKVF